MRINQYVTCIKDMNLLYVQHKVITDTGYVPYVLLPSLIEAKVLFVFFFLPKLHGRKKQNYITSTKYEVDLLRATPFSTYGGYQGAIPNRIE